MNKYKKPGQWKAYLAITWYAFRAQTRNPATFAFGFIFPVVFISIFGLIGGSGSKLNVGIPNDTPENQLVRTIEQQKFLKIERSDPESLNKKLRQGRLSGIVEIKENQSKKYSVTILTSTANAIEAQSLTSAMRGFVNQANLELSGIKNPPITLIQTEVSGRTFRYIDFALPGQIGFSLLSTAIFGTVFGLIYLKKALILKRMFATPTKPLTILLGQGTSRLIIALVQTLLILAIGVVVFKFYLPHGFITFLELIVVSAIGLIAFLGFGYFFAGLANDENSAGPMVNLVTLPQFLLSGTFFPTDSLPTWLQPIANNLPLSYFNLAVRKITTEGGHLNDTVPYLTGLIIWGIVMYLLAARTFRWE
ncbi:MAG TPA: ABC transporter permease [Candidatus Saccharimonadales bacterium]|nr:ABC transporter permease [Candidatus Saccharimonadales bacterium]